MKMRCSICLDDEIKEEQQASLDQCSHRYCYSCILKWSQSSSSCPLCNGSFALITTKFLKIKVATKRQRVAQDDDESFAPSVEVQEEKEPVVEAFSFCQSCGGGDDDSVLILCDFCDVGMHNYCLEAPFTEIPEGSWLCPSCSSLVPFDSQLIAFDTVDDLQLSQDSPLPDRRRRKLICLPSTRRANLTKRQHQIPQIPKLEPKEEKENVDACDEKSFLCMQSLNSPPVSQHASQKSDLSDTPIQRRRKPSKRQLIFSPTPTKTETPEKKIQIEPIALKFPEREETGRKLRFGRRKKKCL